jgi:hypothetical protein
MAFIAPLAAAAIPLLASGTGSTVLTAATAGLGALSAVQQGNYQAAIGRNNARIAEENAARISEVAQREGMRSDIDYRVLLGEQLAAQGASGLDILGRSQQAARELTLRTGRIAAKDIRDEGAAGAQRGLQEAANFRGEARQAKIQGYVSAAGRLAQGASDIGTLVRGRRPRSFERRKTR